MEIEAAIKHLEAALSGPLSEITGSEPWLDLIRSGNLTAAIAEIEKIMQSDSTQAQARLWWIYCQLLLQQVPVMALAAPLEEALPQLKSQPTVPTHVVFICLACALQIHLKQQYVLSAHLFLESIIVLSKSETLSSEVKYNIFSSVCTLLGSALEEVKHDPRQSLATTELQSALEKIKEFNFEKVDRFSKQDSHTFTEAEEIAKSAKHKSHFSAKSILELDDTNQEATSHAPWGEKPSVATNQKRSLTSALVLTTIVLAAATVIYLVLPQSTAKHASIELASEEVNLLLPNINQKDHFLQQESERIVSDLKALSDKLKTIPTPSPVAQSSNTELAQTNQVTEVEAPEPTAPKRQQKPAKDEDLYYQPTTFGDPLGKQPRLDPNEILAPEVEQLDINKNVNRAITPEIGDLKEDTSGRRFGRPVESPEKSPYAERRSLDGGPVQSHEVKLLDPPVHYRTITATDVLSHPSFVSRSLVRLDANSAVLVVAKMGQWLEIRSVQGRQGYVLAQDAIEDTTGAKNQ